MKIIIRTNSRRCMLDTVKRTRQTRQLLHSAVITARVKTALLFTRTAEKIMPPIPDTGATP